MVINTLIHYAYYLCPVLYTNDFLSIVYLSHRKGGREKGWVQLNPVDPHLIRLGPGNANLYTNLAFHL